MADTHERRPEGDGQGYQGYRYQPNRQDLTASAASGSQSTSTEWNPAPDDPLLTKQWAPKGSIAESRGKDCEPAWSSGTKKRMAAAASDAGATAAKADDIESLRAWLVNADKKFDQMDDEFEELLMKAQAQDCEEAKEIAVGWSKMRRRRRRMTDDENEDTGEWIMPPCTRTFVLQGVGVSHNGSPWNSHTLRLLHDDTVKFDDGVAHGSWSATSDGTMLVIEYHYGGDVNQMKRALYNKIQGTNVFIKINGEVWYQNILIERCEPIATCV